MSASEITPGPDIKTDADIANYVRGYADTDYHPACTCRMGFDDMAVVDDEMRVHGVDRLRVVDASIMPDIVSGNLNAPVQMIACRAADYIIEHGQMPPSDVNFHFLKEGNDHISYFEI